MNKIQVKKTASALYLCTVMLLANAAQAGWLADFLCGGDNDPRVCRTHLPDWALRAGQPSKNDKTDALLQEAKQLNGDAKKNFLNKNRKALTAIGSTTPTGGALNNAANNCSATGSTTHTYRGTDCTSHGGLTESGGKCSCFDGTL